MSRKFSSITALCFVSLMILGVFSQDRLIAKVEPMRTIQNLTTVHYDDNSSLSSLWKKYKEAEAKDLPEDQLSILEEIIKFAGSQHLDWDYYDACCKKKEITTRKDWKLREKAEKTLLEQVKDLDSPLISFIYQTEYGSYQTAGKLIKEEELRLKAGKHPDIYMHSNKLEHALNDQLAYHIQDDYEFCLWVMSLHHFQQWGKQLESYLGNRYPAAGWFDLMSVEKNFSPYNFSSNSRKKRMAALNQIQKEYEGTAIACYAREKVLWMEWENSQEIATEEFYQKLYDDSKRFLSDYKKMKSSDKKMCEEPERILRLLEELKGPALRIEIEDKDSVHIYFRNLGSARLKLWREDKQMLIQKKLSTTSRPFYLEEKISVSLPPLEDGTYTLRVENRKISDECIVTYHSLSLAQRENSDGPGVYVADHLTGEPLEKADIHLSKNSSDLEVIRNFPLEKGFTALPDSWVHKIKKDKRYELYATYTDSDGRMHQSDRLSYYSEREDKSNGKNEVYGDLFLSQGAYLPGENLEFKVVLYEGNPYKSFNTLPAQTPICAKIMDSEQNEIGEIPLETDAYGAAAGSFKLPEGLRNGMFMIQILLKGKEICAHYFRVDEFVLPEFKVSFSPQDEIYAPGDEIRIKGLLQSYSGHPVNGTQAHYKIFSYGTMVSEGDLNIDESGEFRIGFKSLSKKNNYGTFYHLQLQVIGTTGETHEYNTAVYVSGRIYLDTEILNEEEADISLSSDFRIPDKGKKGSHPLYHVHLIREDEIILRVKIDRQENNLPLVYCLKDIHGDTLRTGNFLTGETVHIPLKDQEDGIYLLDLRSDTGRKGIQEDQEEIGILKMEKDSFASDIPIDYLFSPYNTDLSEGNECGALFGSNEGETWAIAEWYGEGKRLLDSRFIHLNQEKGNLTDLSFEFKASYPEIVTLQVFYFKNKKSQIFEHDFRRPQESLELPLHWTSFQDKTTPGTHYSFQLQTLANVQCLAAIYDKSLEEIQPNEWNRISLRTRYPDRIRIYSVCGDIDVSHLRNDQFNLSGTFKNKYMTRSEFVPDNIMFAERPVSSMATGAPSPEEMLEKDEQADIKVRSDLATTLTFQPFLQADEKGRIRLEFDTKDQLSTFVVALFAHDQQMNNEVSKKEMVVSVPLKISINEPAFLYDGDEWKMKVVLSSNLDEELSGTLRIEQYVGKDFKKQKPFKKTSIKMLVPARGSASEIIDITADQKKLMEKMRSTGEASLGIKVTFISDDRKISDGVYMNLPIRSSRQTITESHSTLWQPGQDKNELYRELKSRFKNGSGLGAATREISILDMIREAIPKHSQPQGADVLSYADALYIQVIAKSLGITSEEGMTLQQLLDKIMDCRNHDGGFGWFEGMKSSPIITATLLERFAKLNQIAGSTWGKFSDLTASVQYLDQVQFDIQWPYWCGNISLGQYLHVRSLYPSVKFDPEIPGSSKVQEKKMKEFQKEIKEYLIPEGNRGLNGQIFEKARRLMTLMNLTENGSELADSWKLGSYRDQQQSLEEEIATLVQYAVPHRDGGWYYPNLVMPFRGLLESEAYAHAMMCQILDRSDTPRAAEISNGIRLWLMIQKESQDWEAEPGFIDAIHAVLQGPETLKNTSILVMSQRYEKPFQEIQSSGNGMHIQRKFYREATDEEGKYLVNEIAEGATLKVGDVILIRYEVQNEENRSFGKLTAWREAGLMPANQLSGIDYWGIQPLMAGTVFRFVPTSYREVHPDCSIYYMDVIPEHKFEIEEKFYVTRAGTFQAPAIEIESLYAPHYRANEGYPGEMHIK